MRAAHIGALADGVFAIAMTLLAFNLTVPHVPTGADPASFLPGAIRDLWPRFVVLRSALWCSVCTGSPIMLSSG